MPTKWHERNHAQLPEWINKSMNQWMHEQWTWTVNHWINESTNQWITIHAMNRRTNEAMNERMNGWMSEILKTKKIVTVRPRWFYTDCLWELADPGVASSTRSGPCAIFFSVSKSKPYLCIIYMYMYIICIKKGIIYIYVYYIYIERERSTYNLQVHVMFLCRWGHSPDQALSIYGELQGRPIPSDSLYPQPGDSPSTSRHVLQVQQTLVFCWSVKSTWWKMITSHKDLSKSKHIQHPAKRNISEKMSNT